MSVVTGSNPASAIVRTEGGGGFSSQDFKKKIKSFLYKHGKMKEI